MTSRQRQQQKANLLRAIPLESVLKLSGAQPDRYDKSKWHTSQGVISVTGAKFMNWNRGQGGGGAIDLVIHLNGFDFRQALSWLEGHFRSELFPHASESGQNVTSTPAQAKWQPPWPDPTKLGSVRAYLLNRRGLPPEVIDRLIRSKSLYADGRANAVFLLLGQDGAPVGAELRGTTPRPWHSMAGGSRKDSGFFSVPDRRHVTASSSVQAVILCESAIDAISCSVLYPNHWCLSTAGVRSNPQWLVPLLAQGYRIYCGFDADATGEAMAQVMRGLYPAIERLAPPAKDWNALFTSRP